jgi:hypothetical protein
MIASTRQSAMLKKLKKQVRSLENKEIRTRKKLRLALSKVKKIAYLYEKKLRKKTRPTKIKTKLKNPEAALYTKLAQAIKKHADQLHQVQKAVALKAAAVKKRSPKKAKKKKSSK